LGDLGLNQVVLREISRKENDSKGEEKIISAALLIRMGSSAILMILALLFALLLPYSLDIKKGIVLVSLGLFFSSGYQTLSAIFQKRLLAYKVSFLELLGRICNLLWVWACFSFDKGLLWILWGLVFSWTITFLGVFFITKKEIKISFLGSGGTAKRLIKEALPLGISAIVTFLYFRIDTIILSVVKGSQDVGLYGAAYKIIENLSYFPAMFMGLVAPLFSRYVFNDHEKFNKIRLESLKAIALAATGISFGVFALAPEIVKIINGPGFEKSVWALRLLTPSIFGIFLGQYFNSVLIAANLQKRLLKIFLLAAFLNISLNLILIPKYSFLAAAVISSVTEVVVFSLSAFFVFSKFKKIFFSNIFFRLLLSGTGMVLVLVSLNSLFLPFRILAGGGTYLLLAGFFGIFSIKDIREMLKGNNVS
jgi:O-antigen/teichoic acid export membrane protein